MRALQGWIFFKLNNSLKNLPFVFNLSLKIHLLCEKYCCLCMTTSLRRFDDVITVLHFLLLAEAEAPVQGSPGDSLKGTLERQFRNGRGL